MTSAFARGSRVPDHPFFQNSRFVRLEGFETHVQEFAQAPGAGLQAPGFRLQAPGPADDGLAPDTEHRALGTEHVAPLPSHLAPGTAQLAPGTRYRAPGTEQLASRTGPQIPATEHLAPRTDHLAPSTEHPASDPAVVLVNGGMASTFQWHAIVPPLAGCRRVIAYDWPGQGLSERPRERRYYEPDFLARHLRAVVEHFHTEPAHVVAGSIGAAIALRYALRRPEAVRTLTLVAGVGFSQRLQAQVAAFKHAAFVRLSLLPGVRRLYGSGRLARRWMRSLCERPPSDADIELYTRVLMSEGPAGYAWPYHHVLHAFRLEEPASIEAEYARIACPVLLIWGDRDRYVPLEHGRRFQETFPRATLAVIPRCGHWPPGEAPEETVEAMLEFLARAEASRG